MPVLFCKNINKRYAQNHISVILSLQYKNENNTWFAAVLLCIYWQIIHGLYYIFSLAWSPLGCVWSPLGCVGRPYTNQNIVQTVHFTAFHFIRCYNIVDILSTVVLLIIIFRGFSTTKGYLLFWPKKCLVSR